ncbi:MAG TPA: cytochrome P450 [Pseudonocardiaceae bacterium]|jgi:cytochrome P450
MTQLPVLSVLVQRDRFDPDDELARLRAEQPISRIDLPWGEPAWLVTRFEDVRTVMGDAARFANSAPLTTRASDSTDETKSVSSAGSGLIGSYDPPEHTALRRMLLPEFTAKRMRSLTPRIEAIVTEHLDAMAHGERPADLVQAFALPIPSLVICELLGVPYADRAAFQLRSAQRLDMAASVEDRVRAVEESRAYMAELVRQQRKQPGAALIGRLISEHGADIDDRELTGLADLLLLAGHETTANMLALGTLLLLLHPEQARLMRERDDAVNDGVEELLRYLTVVNSGLPRIAQVDLELSGQQIKAGELLVCSLPAANRDDELGRHIDEFDLTRKVATHVAFGHGIHHCLGAPLARVEMRIAYPALLRRFPTLRLAVPVEDVPFRVFSAVYGLEALPVTW